MTPANSTPLSVATAETYRFVRHQLSTSSDRNRRRRVLEVGCGDGALAARLVADGFDVIALDSSADAVRGARAAGVDARTVAWPAFEPAPNDGHEFDSILFARSLHHIHPLGPALDRASELLMPAGLVIVEDFAFADVDRRTAAWLFAELTAMEEAGWLAPKSGEFATRVLDGGGAYELWHADHDHDITSASEMHAALAERFEIVFEAQTPYLYRYVCPLLPSNGHGGRLAREIHEREQAAAARGDIALIGRRWVARASPPQRRETA